MKVSKISTQKPRGRVVAKHDHLSNTEDGGLKDVGEGNDSSLACRMSSQEYMSGLLELS